jgi:transcriptional antiterminator NusG
MWYVLQVSTGQEATVRGELQKMDILALVPMENRLIRKGGGWTHKEYTLFPGYVFVNLEYTAENYYRVKEIPAVIRFLGASGLAPSQLTYLEAEWIKALAGIDGQPLQPTRVRELPDGSLKIVEGVLSNFATRTIQYDKRSRRAKVEITLCGEPRTIQLSVEVVGSV